MKIDDVSAGTWYTSILLCDAAADVLSHLSCCIQRQLCCCSKSSITWVYRLLVWLSMMQRKWALQGWPNDHQTLGWAGHNAFCPLTFVHLYEWL